MEIILILFSLLLFSWTLTFSQSAVVVAQGLLPFPSGALVSSHPLQPGKTDFFSVRAESSPSGYLFLQDWIMAIDQRIYRKLLLDHHGRLVFQNYGGLGVTPIDLRNPQPAAGFLKVTSGDPFSVKRS